jgi:UDP-N-acetylglucosamine 2-epimerase (non-hydrolysing)
VSKLIIDVILRFQTQIEKSQALERFNVNKAEYFLCTAHRPENVNDKTVLSNMLRGIELACSEYGLPAVLPLHPHTIANIKNFGLRPSKDLKITSAIGFLDFSKLEKNAFCIVTDSGTVQEDACYFHVPCVTARISTERPETLDAGGNMLANRLKSNQILKCVRRMVEVKRKWNVPYTSGSAEKIVKAIRNREEQIRAPKKWW